MFPKSFPKSTIVGVLLTAIIGIVAVAMSCDDGGRDRRVVASYDPFTSRLVQISADQNGDGRLDQWSFLDGNTVRHGEADVDGDGRIDRWEYFDDASALVSVGTSSLNDGIEDTWTFVAPTAQGEIRIARSRKRDRLRDRDEYFRGTALVRAEEDTNGDGRPDRWERYDGAVLREVSFDTTYSDGRPDRRLVYDAAGRFVAIEADQDHDGTFERLPEPPSKP